ncbi:triphosphoribosyl-dephospho-CoA synthase [Jiella marina]|uniref:triphosphoribosyl-dephospho-CoA synthase n=1 Tax=Jiella sp. LLJ827 TaxID=2917712 RepID=UPI00210106B1|nr:triphosphoribosyl-dephospho-CoA synthase [Jiella sp. LLJ827]MCQ0990104.1 triphosphoribosyl-dephospho-CoA synthase [Jiella sp. LLJ827]
MTVGSERAGMIERAFLAACRAEIETLKPGNVHRFAAGHRMTIDTFLQAAEAAAPAMAERGAPVGRRILRATEASFAAVGVNANLGILLLCAPLAKAAEAIAPSRAGGEVSADLQVSLKRVLAELQADDARQAFAAIALASPGGLGERADHDVKQPPRIGLVEAMALAADADLVARQYRDGFREIFEIGLPAYDSSPFPPDGDLGDGPTLAVFLAFARQFPDSHILRKFGTSRAEETRRRFAEFSNTLKTNTESPDRLRHAMTFDAALKQEGLNPGTSADLTVATVFAKNLAEGLAG